MKRETKYRAWLTELEELIPAEQVLGFVNEPIDGKMNHDVILKYSLLPLKGGYCVEEENSEHYILMQYTGLRDKNNKEICDGDLVKPFGLEPTPIFYHNGGYGYQSSSKFDDFILLGGNHNFKWKDCQSDKIEVVGMIYKNPELLNQN